MTPGAWKLTGVGLALVLLLVLGAAGGGRLAACHYRPLLDVANTDLATAKLARDNLETLAGEQGRKLGELVLAGELRERNAALAQEKARQEAQPDYAAANNLLRERTGGDPAQAASAIIDKELGL
ncbi:hypothetical protein [Pseudomonas lundensis]|uniref:Uncharacterized protein n=1 Tax=Pseudomonas lundensis TaxID=86185 RepID=A0ABX4GJ01_9PSED|nr:hypothetical protein [Pseudomonas lundensis]AOZ14927.1 hypothetical protein AA042_21495 [Pseudomonas lundensis]MCT8955046.1 hypothetical protein [Pseudomonas lundensis]OZY26534.1 hypothetical protein CJF40_18905 [Pseudomonas lundensis]OZY45253.1 hypothetical protein CJF41_16350 [Pseudomonas lundensis]OZY54098.1 hypothetical protein CJF38_16670 [Pseudomonas lundensis]